MSENRVILLVEDNQRDQKLTQVALQRNNIQVDLKFANDGAEALDYLFGTGAYAGQAHPIPKVILLDLKMPKLDGHQTLKRLRENERTKRIPVVILTTSKQERDIMEGYDLGVSSYIRKPVDFQEFTETIRKLAEYWLDLNETVTTVKEPCPVSP